jgi:hypothetical protein
MSFLPASRTKRRLLKIASLGLAGLLAGLLAGCNEDAAPGDTLSTDVSAGASSLPSSIEATQIPALRHPPSARHLQLGSVHTVSQISVPNGRSHS